MKKAIRLCFLGTVLVERDGKPVGGFRSRKALALLAYLALQAQPIPRERLVDLFWEDKPESVGRANLSWVMGRISSLLPGCLAADRHTVQFKRGPPYWLDIDAFEELEAQGDPPALASAAALCRGELLEGMCLDGCAEFDLWLVAERERWRQRAADVLGELVTRHSQRGEYEEGQRYARELLALEPWREETHQQVMQLLAWSGQRGAAMAQYQACRRALAEELGVAPAAETTRLYEHIRDGALETSIATAVHFPDFSIPSPSFLGVGQELIESPVCVARERELAQLGKLLDAAMVGQGRVVFVAGDAGQGKTTLIREFVRQAQAAHPDLVVVGGSGNAYTGMGDPYLPFREALGLLTGDVEARWAAGAIDREQARRLWNMLPLAVQTLVETGPDLIGTFLPGAPLAGRATAMGTMTPMGVEWLPRLQELARRETTLPSRVSLQQGDLFEQYTRVLRRLAQERPLMLALDDLQWVDVGSAGLLFHLGRRIEGSRILIVGAYRPAEVAARRGDERHPLAPALNEFKRRWGDTEVNLEGIEGRQFVNAFLDAEPNRLGVAFRESLYRQTGGHPLFTVELLRGMQERGDLIQDEEGWWMEEPMLDWETLPARVEAVIAERIGQLPNSLRRALAAASVEGETFTAEVAARVQGADVRETVESLSNELDRRYRLVQAQGIQRVGTERLSLYRFRHVLFQRYLYNGLDVVERAHLHEAVGTALETLYGGAETAPVAGQLAWHFQEAGAVEKAVEYLRQAGERAARLSAHQEAIAHYRRGLALLESLPEAGGEERRLERDRMELALRVGLVVSLQAIEGYGNPELDRVYTRARELCRRMGTTPQLLPVLSHLVILYSNRGEHRAAREIAQQYLDLAERTGNSASIASAHYVLGWHMVILGEFAQARTHLERALALYNQQQHRSLALLYGHDFGVAARLFLSWALWFLGYPEQALRQGQEGLSLAQELSHAFSLARAHGLLCVLHALRRDVRSVEEFARTCACLSAEQGFPYWAVFGTFHHGWVLVQQGRAEEGVEEMSQSIVDAKTVGATVGYTLRLALLAEAHGRAGRAREGLALLAEAMEASRCTGERVYEAEICRLRGEQLRQEAEAETCFHEAIQVARQQGAKSWELRGTTSLCRLWRRLGKREQARRRLAEIYNWFTEGFDTPDLQEARTLLNELA